jgi:hypothetical protein
MPVLSKFEDVWQALLRQYPMGTIVHGEELIDFVEELPNGHAIKDDLLVADPGKQVSAIRRHFNHGGSSRNLSELERGVLEVVDAKRKTFRVITLASHTIGNTDGTFIKSGFGAINPIKRQMSAMQDIKKEELSDEQRTELERDLDFTANAFVPLAKIVHATTINRAVNVLVSKGVPEANASVLLELQGMMTQYGRLLKASTV